MPPTRTFTIAELQDLDIPCDPDAGLADEPVGEAKYGQYRRRIFEHDGGVWAVEYERPDTDYGDDDYGPRFGWWGDTVTATAVRPERGAVTRWVPVETDGVTP